MNRATLGKKIDKKTIDELKNDTNVLLSFLENQNDGTIIYTLEKLGKLDNDNSRNPLLNLLENPNEKIRSLSIKNLAKIGDIKLLDIFVKHAHHITTSIRLRLFRKPPPKFFFRYATEKLRILVTLGDIFLKNLFLKCFWWALRNK